MPGFTGFLSFEYGSKDNPLLEQLAKPLCYGLAEKASSVLLNEYSGLSIVGYPNIPDWCTISRQQIDKNTVVIFQGCIVNREEIAGYLSPRRDEAFSSADLFLDLWERFGTQALEKVEGQFSAVVLEVAKKRVHLISDRFGTQPLAYSVHNRRVIFGSGIKALVGDPILPRELNETAVAEFFTYGFPLGNHTFLKNVHLVPPSNILTIDESTKNRQTYWRPNLMVEQKSSTSEIVERVVDAMDQAAGRIGRIFSPRALMLSGGLDSRVILGAFKKADLELRCGVVGPIACQETRLARATAEICGYSCVPVEYRMEDFDRWTWETVWFNEGLTDTCEFILLSNRLAEFKPQILLHGVGGDTVLGRVGDKRIARARSVEELKRAAWGTYVDGLFPQNQHPNYFTPAVLKITESELPTLFRNTFEEIPSDIPFDTIIRWHTLMQRLRRRTIPTVDVGRAFMPTYAFFLDSRFAVMNLQIPLYLKRDRKIARLALDQIDRKFMDLPTFGHKCSARIEPKLAGFYRLRGALAKRMGSIRRAYMKKMHLDPTGGVNARAFQNDRQVIIADLMQSCLSHRGIFQEESILTLIEQYQSGNLDLSKKIHRIVTFEIFCQLYVDNRWNDLIHKSK